MWDAIVKMIPIFFQRDHDLFAVRSRSFSNEIMISFEINPDLFQMVQLEGAQQESRSKGVTTRHITKTLTTFRPGKLFKNTLASNTFEKG